MTRACEGEILQSAKCDIDFILEWTTGDRSNFVSLTSGYLNTKVQFFNWNGQGVRVNGVIFMLKNDEIPPLNYVNRERNRCFFHKRA